MNLVDVGLWFMKRADAMGRRLATSGTNGCAAVWESPWDGAVALLSSLNCDYLAHLGVEHARDSDKSHARWQQPAQWTGCFISASEPTGGPVAFAVPGCAGSMDSS